MTYFLEFVKNLIFFFREHAKIPIVSRSKRLPGAGRKLKDLDLENYLINYVNDKLDSNQPLTRKALMDEGFKYLREKEKTGQVNHIKVSKIRPSLVMLDILLLLTYNNILIQ